MKKTLLIRRGFFICFTIKIVSKKSGVLWHKIYLMLNHGYTLTRRLNDPRCITYLTIITTTRGGGKNKCLGGR